MNTPTDNTACRAHDYFYVRTQQRHNRRTGARMTPAVIQRCTCCRKERMVNADTGRVIRQG